jgi:hypothetical protein
MKHIIPQPDRRRLNPRLLAPIALLGMAALSCQWAEDQSRRIIPWQILDPELADRIRADQEAATQTAEAEALEEPALPEGAVEGPEGEIPPGGFAEEQIPEGLGGGDVQITLLWVGDADIDLHVVDPFGEEIYFFHETSSSGGFLDHDTIPCGSDIAQPVENVFWPSGGAPRGHYEVVVVYYSRCVNPDATPFEVIVRLDGQIYDRRTGSINESERLEIMGFDY